MGWALLGRLGQPTWLPLLPTIADHHLLTTAAGLVNLDGDLDSSESEEMMDSLCSVLPLFMFSTRTESRPLVIKCNLILS